MLRECLIGRLCDIRIIALEMGCIIACCNFSARNGFANDKILLILICLTK